MIEFPLLSTSDCAAPVLNAHSVGTFFSDPDQDHVVDMLVSSGRLDSFANRVELHPSLFTSSIRLRPFFDSRTTPTVGILDLRPFDDNIDILRTVHWHLFGAIESNASLQNLRPIVILVKMRAGAHDDIYEKFKYSSSLSAQVLRRASRYSERFGIIVNHKERGTLWTVETNYNALGLEPPVQAQPSGGGRRGPRMDPPSQHGYSGKKDERRVFVLKSSGSTQEQLSRLGDSWERAWTNDSEVPILLALAPEMTLTEIKPGAEIAETPRSLLRRAVTQGNSVIDLLVDHYLADGNNLEDIVSADDSVSGGLDEGVDGHDLVVEGIEFTDSQTIVLDRESGTTIPDENSLEQ